jgi:hypothetical protein
VSTTNNSAEVVVETSSPIYRSGYIAGRDEGVRLVVVRDVDGLEATRGRLPADAPPEVRAAYNEAIAILRDAAAYVDPTLATPEPASV